MEQIKREKPAYRSLLDFYEKIYVEKEWCHQALAPAYAIPDEEYIRIRREKGFPILDKSAMQFDMEILEEFFRRLLLLSREKSADAAAKLALYLEEDSARTRNLIRETWEGTPTLDASEEEELGDPTLLWFLLIECVKPLYECCAQVLREFIVPESWKQGHCPVCGKLPPIAAISLQERTTFLFCIYCGTEWSFPLLRCPFCAHEEEDMKCLQVENERQYRIEVCRACGKYLKTINPELFGSAVPLDIEHIVTLHLDILAQQQGYRRGSSFPLLI